MKILYMSMHPAPYRDPIIIYLKKLYKDNFQILTLYPDQTTHKEWRLSHMPYESITMKEPLTFYGIDYHSEIIRILNSGKYDIVFVCGYIPLTGLATYIWCKTHNIKIVYSADTIEACYGSRKPKPINRILGMHADALYVPGKAARQMWENLGVKSEKIYEGMYMLDYPQILKAYGRYEEDDERIIHLLQKIEEKNSYLFIGHFIKSRNVMNLVKAYEMICKDEDVLILVGKGEQYDEVNNYINRKRVKNVFLFRGLPFTKIHQFYLKCKYYVHPGKEPYSVSLQEAAFAGMKIVSTCEVGASLDYIVEGINGIIVPNNDIEALAGALNNVKHLNCCKEELSLRLKDIVYAKGQVRQLLNQLNS